MNTPHFLWWLYNGIEENMDTFEDEELQYKIFQHKIFQALVGEFQSVRAILDDSGSCYKENAKEVMR